MYHPHCKDDGSEDTNICERRSLSAKEKYYGMSGSAVRRSRATEKTKIESVIKNTEMNIPTCKAGRLIRYLLYLPYIHTSEC